MRLLLSSVLLTICGLGAHPGWAAPAPDTPSGSASGQEGGDQFLDGIGETSMVSRYLLNGAARDWSRNSLHGALRGEGGTFAADPRFGSVLALPGTGGAFLEVPRGVMEGVDTFSFSGWVFLEADGAQPLLDLGAAAGEGLSLTSRELRLRLGGKEERLALSLPAGRWVHLAVVVDPSIRALGCYLDGVPVGAPAGRNMDLARLTGPRLGAGSRILLGRLEAEGGATLKGRFHDLRFYRVALSPSQVETIHQNASGGRRRNPGRPPAPAARLQTPVLSGWLTRLVRVPGIRVETPAGYLPRLPYEVPGVYAKGARGPRVRVIWPSPEDNRQALQAGTYEITGKVPGTALTVQATVTVKAGPLAPAPARQLEAFPLDRVVLGRDARGQESLLVHDREKFLHTLARTNPDDFLYMFRNAFGQTQPKEAKALGVWDSQTTKLRGHATGHYLSALAQAYAGSGYDKALQETFRRKMDHMIETLHGLAAMSGTPREAGGPCVEDPTRVPVGPGHKGYDSNLSEEGIRTDSWNWGKGFISAYPPDQFILLEQGALYGGQDNQVWAPYYTLHKILAGLLDCYEVGGNPKALEVAKGMGLWVHARLKGLPTETRISMWNRYIAGEYGGMNEVLARLSRLTRDPRFLDCAKLFDNISFFFGDAAHAHGIEKNVDTFRGKHANQHIPQILGALETYHATLEAPYWHIADNFWDVCMNQYSYTIGGVAGAARPDNAECFTAQPSTLWQFGFAEGGQNETCATYNLLKLDRQLFMFQPDAKFMDHYERGLYNHILASVAEEDPGNTYHVPLNPGAMKQFSNGEMDGFTCCNGTALESHTKLQDSIYFRSQDQGALFVNLFVPSTLSWTERQVKVVQETAFPFGDTTTLRIQGAGRFALKVRVPGWATQGFSVKVNGKPRRVKALPGTYLELGRAWKDGDTVEVRMPFGFHLDPVMDQPNIASLCYGPVVLAAQEPAARTDWRKITLPFDLAKGIQGDPRTLHFKVGDVEFKPFFESFGRHSVYLDVTLK